MNPFRSILLLLPLLSLTLTASAKKDFEYKLTLRSLAGQEALEGISVSVQYPDGTTHHKYSESDGTAIFYALDEREFTVIIIDEHGTYRDKEFTVSNDKKQDISRTIYLRFTEAKEREFVQSKLHVEIPVDTISNNLSLESKMADAEEDECIDSTHVATYPGGYLSMYRFIQEQMVYPDVLFEEGVQGKVIIRFAVNEDGSLSELKITRGLTAETDYEVLRIFAYMPNWTPATCFGKPVRSYYQIPLSFFRD